MEDKWQALGFKRKPYIDLSRVNPFLTAKQRQQLNLLEELVREGGHLLLLLGVAGVGKTTFLNVLKKNITLPGGDANIGVCEMQGDHGVNIAMIQSLLAKHLDIDDNADNFMPTLRARLAQLAQSQQRFLLMIDDAHELPAETVRFILDLIAELDESEHSLSILLAGRLQLEHLCVSSANVNMDWNTGSSFTVILQPLGEEDVVNYIKHGLRQAGYRGVMPFSKTQFFELTHESKGILARLVVIAVDILETKARGIASSHSVIPRLSKAARAALGRRDEPMPAPRTETQPRAKAKINKSHKTMLIALFAMVLFSVVWWFYLEGPQPTAVDMSQGKVVSVEKDGPWVKTVVKLDGNVRRDDITAPATPVIQEAAPVVSVATVAATPAMNDAVAATPAANAAPTPAGQNTVTATPVINAAPAAQSTAVATPTANIATPPVAQNTVTTTPVANAAPAPAVKDTLVTTPIANDNASSVPVAVADAAEPIVSTPAAAVVAKPQKKSISVPAATPKKATPAASVKPQGYTVQVAGGSSLTAVQKSVCQLWTQQATTHCSGIPANMRYIHTIKDGQDWYIATQGEYNSSAEAHAQLQKLPANVQKNTPWVRSFAQIPNLTVVANAQ